MLLYSCSSLMIFQIKNNLQYILFELKPFLENYNYLDSKNIGKDHSGAKPHLTYKRSQYVKDSKCCIDVSCP